MKRRTLLLGCLGVLVVLGLILAFTMSGDDPLMADGDLLPPSRIALADRDNAHFLLQEIATELGAGGSLDPMALELAVNAPGYQAPAMDIMGGGPDVLAMMQVADSAALLVDIRIQGGDPGEARRLALLMLDMSDLVSSGCRTALEYMVSLRLETLSVDALMGTIRARPPSRSEAREICARLAVSEPSVAQLRNVIRGEYVYSRDAVTGLEEGQYDAVAGAAPVNNTFLFKPNRTRNRAVVFYRELLARAELPYADFQSRAELEPAPSGFGAVSSILGGNFVGDTLMRLTMVNGDLILARRFPIAARFACARALVAVAAYEKEVGELPERLDQLVPEYLSALPVDPYDGKPVRYAREDRAVYSIGSDLRDEGGGDPASTDDSEPTLSLQTPAAPDEGVRPEDGGR